MLDGTGLGADSMSGAVDAAGAVAEAAAQGGGGLNLNPVELLTGLTEASITGLHDVLQGLGVPSPYGLSIIFFTLFVKGITFPLTYQQLSSTTKIQTLAPKVRCPLYVYMWGTFGLNRRSTGVVVCGGGCTVLFRVLCIGSQAKVCVSCRDVTFLFVCCQGPRFFIFFSSLAKKANRVCLWCSSVYLPCI